VGRGGSVTKIWRPVAEGEIQGNLRESALTPSDSPEIPPSTRSGKTIPETLGSHLV